MLPRPRPGVLAQGCSPATALPGQRIYTPGFSQAPAGVGPAFIDAEPGAAGWCRAPRFFSALGALRITGEVTLFYRCLKWLYLRGRAWARRPCKSPQCLQHSTEGRSVPIWPRFSWGCAMGGAPGSPFPTGPLLQPGGGHGHPFPPCLALLPAETLIKW